MDSCVTAATARAQGYELFLCHVTYHQRTWRRELQAFRDIARFYHVPKDRQLVAELPHLGRIGGSSLTDLARPVAHGEPDGGSIPETYVPFRNTQLLAAAVAWAEVVGAGAVYFGANEVDYSGYPDCREAYFRAYQTLIDLGTRPETHIHLVTPLLRLSKADIVRRGRELGAPLELSWSCYEREDQACGLCGSCRLRRQAFQEAGVPDPIPYVGGQRPMSPPAGRSPSAGEGPVAGGS
jgi:7-cyano-7-deazaguanine synthase